MDLAHAVNDMAESRIDDVVVGDTEERCEWRGIWNVVGGKCAKRIDLIGNKMNLVFLAKSHVFNHDFSRITSATLDQRTGRIILSEGIMRSAKYQYPGLYPLLFGRQQLLLISNNSFRRKHIKPFQVHPQ